MTDYFFQIFFMGTSCVALSIKNTKTRASREMTSQQKWGERCQALECGRARYLPSLIALFITAFSNNKTIMWSICRYNCRVMRSVIIAQWPFPQFLTALPMSETHSAFGHSTLRYCVINTERLKSVPFL